MAQDSKAIYKTQWDIEVPNDPTGTAYPSNMANFIANRVDGKLSMTGGITLTAPAQFTFNKGVFIPLITALQPTTDPVEGRKKIADAWLAAVTASTMVVQPGAYIGTPTPPTIFSVVAPVVIIPAAGYASLLAGLLAAPLAGAPGTTKFPEELYTAMTLVTFTVTGLDSQPPPDGPKPLATVGTAI